MRKILLTLLFAFAPITHAGVGDVYYCAWQKTSFIDPKMRDGPRLEALSGSFTLKWEEAEIIIKSEYAEEVKPLVSSDGESFTSFAEIAINSATTHGHEYWNYRDKNLQYVMSVNTADKRYVRVNFASCEQF